QKKNAPGVLGRFSWSAQDERLPWVRRRPQIRLQFLEALREELLGIGVGYRGGDHDVGAGTLDRPVRRRAHLVLARQLQRIECTQNLVEIAAYAHRVDQDQGDLLVRVDQEDVAHGLIVHW